MLDFSIIYNSQLYIYIQCKSWWGKNKHPNKLCYITPFVEYPSESWKLPTRWSGPHFLMHSALLAKIYLLTKLGGKHPPNVLGAPAPNDRLLRKLLILVDFMASCNHIYKSACKFYTQICEISNVKHEQIYNSRWQLDLQWLLPMYLNINLSICWETVVFYTQKQQAPKHLSEQNSTHFSPWLWHDRI